MNLSEELKELRDEIIDDHFVPIDEGAIRQAVHKCMTEYMRKSLGFINEVLNYD